MAPSPTAMTIRRRRRARIDGPQQQQDGQDHAADGDGVEGLHDALDLLELGSLEERDGREVVRQGHVQRPFQERPARGPELEARRVGQLGVGRDDADLLELAEDGVDERVDVEVDDAVTRLEDRRVATQEGHDLRVQGSIRVDPHGLEVRRDQHVPDDLLERLLDLVGDRAGDDRGRSRQDLFQSALDIQGADRAGGHLAADGVDDGRVAGDRSDHGRVTVTVEQDLVRPDRDAAEDDRDRAQHEQEAGQQRPSPRSATSRRRLGRARAPSEPTDAAGVVGAGVGSVPLAARRGLGCRSRCRGAGLWRRRRLASGGRWRRSWSSGLGCGPLARHQREP